MRVLYSLPLIYFWATRLRVGKFGLRGLAFAGLFEWLPAVVLILVLSGDATHLVRGVLAYLAFISLYEIGYIVNDVIIAPRENHGRLRGPQGVKVPWLLLWFGTRLAIFVLITWRLDELADVTWWSFFGAIALVYALHNALTDPMLRIGSFLWLSWFRFMAPVFFVVPVNYLMGVSFGCAMTYCTFRLLGYEEDKELVRTPRVRRPIFRAYFFTLPLIALLPLWQLTRARGALIVILYFAIVVPIWIGAKKLGGVSGSRTPTQ